MESIKIIIALCEFAKSNPYAIGLILIICILERKYAVKILSLLSMLIFKRPIDFSLSESYGLGLDYKGVLTFQRSIIPNQKKFYRKLKCLIDEHRRNYDCQGMTFLFLELPRAGNSNFWNAMAQLLDYLIERDDMFVKLIFPRQMDTKMAENFQTFKEKIERVKAGNIIAQKDAYSESELEALVKYYECFTGTPRERAEQSLSLRNQ